VIRLLTLGEIEGVSVVSTGAPLAVNLWMDSGGDGSIFSFDSSTGLMLSLNGDSYAGCGPPSIDTTTSNCYMLGGNGAGGSYTLSQLQSGAVAGINSSTVADLWIGITNPGGQTLAADITSITVTTPGGAVPEPGTMTMIGGLGLGLFALARKRRNQRNNL